MNRIIKFRALDIKTKEWRYGHYHEGSHGHYISDAATGALWQIDPQTVGQFTGLLDKNDKEIYEGDIVKGAIEEYNGRFSEVVGHELYTIVWNNNSAAFIGQPHEYIDNSYLGMDDLLGCEIIGNIY